MTPDIIEKCDKLRRSQYKDKQRNKNMEQLTLPWV